MEPVQLQSAFVKPIFTPRTLKTRRKLNHALEGDQKVQQTLLRMHNYNPAGSGDQAIKRKLIADVDETYDGIFIHVSSSQTGIREHADGILKTENMERTEMNVQQREEQTNTEQTVQIEQEHPPRERDDAITQISRYPAEAIQRGSDAPPTEPENLSTASPDGQQQRVASEPSVITSSHTDEASIFAKYLIPSTAIVTQPIDDELDDDLHFEPTENVPQAEPVTLSEQDVSEHPTSSNEDKKESNEEIEKEADPVKLDPNGQTEIEREMVELYNRTDPEPLYSASVQKQNDLVLKTYLPFCRAVKQDPWPLAAKVVVSYLFWLAEYRNYCVSTIDYIVTWALVRLNVFYTKAQVDRYVTICMRAAVNQLYKDPQTKKPTKGMKPLVLADVEKMISHIPDSDARKSFWASLFLFALATGSRASTCLAITLRDLDWIRRDGKGNMAVTIIKRKIKGKINPHDPVTLAGVPGEASATNFIYWLNRRIEAMGERSLEDVVERNKAGLFVADTRIWPISVDGMTIGIKRKLESAGLESTGYGSHSFRSGMLASVILNYQDLKNGTLQNALDTAAIIGNWAFRSEILERYIKEHTKVNLVTTNLNGTSNFDTSTEKMSTEDFHHEAAKEPKPPRIIVTPVKTELAKRLYREQASPLENSFFFDRCWNFACSKYPAHRGVVTNVSYEKRATIGRRMISQEIAFNMERVSSIVDDLVAILQTSNRLLFFPVITAEEESQRAQRERERKTANSSKQTEEKRHNWTQTEVDALVRLVTQGFTWDEIVTDPALTHLSKLQCQYKITSLNRDRADKLRVKRGKRTYTPPYRTRRLDEALTTQPLITEHTNSVDPTHTPPPVQDPLEAPAIEALSDGPVTEETEGIDHIAITEIIDPNYDPFEQQVRQFEQQMEEEEVRRLYLLEPSSSAPTDDHEEADELNELGRPSPFSASIYDLPPGNYHYSKRKAMKGKDFDEE